MKSPRILVFGDSIGQGFYDEEHGGWVQRLQRDYIAEAIAGKSEVNVINLSVSGHSSNEVLERVESETRSRDKYDIMTILAIGTNDTYERDGVRRTNEVAFEQNITQIIKISQSFGEVIVLGLGACVDTRVQPTIWDETLVYKNELLRNYEMILQRVVETNSVSFIPLWETSNRKQGNEETLPDGIHPNSVGHELIYSQVKNKLKDFGL